MTKLSKKEIEIEIEASKAALAAHIRGQLVHEIVIRAFEDELELMEDKKMLKEIKDAPVSGNKGA